MIGLIIILLVFLAVYLLLTESVFFQLTIDGYPKLKISFTLFSFEFNISDDRKTKSSLKQKIESSLFAIRFFNHALRSSSVTVESYEYNRLIFGDSAFPKIHIAFLAPAFLAYIKSRASMTEINESVEGNGINIKLSIVLFSLFISFIKASYYTLKKKITRK